MQKDSFQELIQRKIGPCSVKLLKSSLIDVSFRKPMRLQILKINEVAPEIFDFSKVALADFEFDTPALKANNDVPGRYYYAYAVQGKAIIT